MDEYVVYESFIVPIKGQLPDVQCRYLSGSLYPPEYTNSLKVVLKFEDIEKVKGIAKDLLMEVGRIVTHVKKVY
ncbi:hypothetical protein [Lysinibacillus sp. LZ02]|uniref:hypothetical protein n=1 Tax=Lysinibacillus sp. LZ02 TaxID=3420668 RepID=UPI003D35EB5D